MHIGIIPDGNRRWCKMNNIDYTTQHITEIWLKIFKSYLYDHFKNERLRLFGNLSLEETEKAIDIMDKIPEFKIDSEITEISLFVASVNNCKRHDNTLNHISEFLKLVMKSIDGVLTKDSVYKIPVAIELIGDTSYFPTTLVESIHNYNKISTKKFRINLAIGYDPKEDLKHIINNTSYRRESRQSQIDLVIRSGGEIRTSGFFPYHTLNAEWIFIDKLWPDVTKEDLVKCIDEYKNRTRRFGF